MNDRPISTQEKCDCVRRELARRVREYPGMVKDRRMRSVVAANEIVLMTAIVDDYCRKADQERRLEQLL